MGLGGMALLGGQCCPARRLSPDATAHPDPAVLSLGIDALVAQRRVEPQEAPRLSALLMISFTVGAQFAALLMGELAEHFGLRAAYAVLVVAALGFLGAARVLARRT